MEDSSNRSRSGAAGGQPWRSRRAGQAVPLWQRVGRLVPVGFVLGMVGWAYYVYVVLLLGRTVPSRPLAVFMGIVFHICLAMLLWSYYKAVSTPIQDVPPKWSLTEDEFMELKLGDIPASLKQRNLPVKTHDGKGSLRWCPTCKLVKPDRCRHCSVCRRCVMRFDHCCPWYVLAWLESSPPSHCLQLTSPEYLISLHPWHQIRVANCVGWHNYKYFCLFLFYAIIFLLYIFTSAVRFAVASFDGQLPDAPSIQISLICLVSVMFMLSVGGLLGLHTTLVLSNNTTIDFGSKLHTVLPHERGYNLGSRRANFELIFGPNPRLWLIPVWSSLGTGDDFPIKFRQGSEEGMVDVWAGRSQQQQAGDASAAATDAQANGNGSQSPAARPEPGNVWDFPEMEASSDSEAEADQRAPARSKKPAAKLGRNGDAATEPLIAPGDSH